MNPWDKMPTEDGKWFERFDKFYRPLGPGRTLTEAYRIYYAEKHGEPPDRPGATADWHNKAKMYQWRERAEAWDAEVRAEILEAEKETIKDMAERHVKQSRAIQTLAMDTILSEGFGNDTATALRAFRQAVSIERSSRGIPDYIAEVHEMDDEELTRELAKELARAGVHQADIEALHKAEDEVVIEAEESERGEAPDSVSRDDDGSSNSISD